MSACEQVAAQASAGVAPALRAVDCLAGETTAAAFGRLFGSGGALLPALTIILTLYIAFFAVSLLTGRSRLGISALTPRMLTLGMVLTFATSWVAYQGVVWNLTIGAPDQIAGVLMGARGSATQIFADRIDMVFAAIADAANAGKQVAAQAAAAQGAEGVPAAAASGSFTPANLMWLGALLLMLGTVGVLVTARIALAVLLALGPIFIVFALFSGTRGLCAGWLRGVVLTAVTPLFVVIGGGIVLELLVPVVSALGEPDGVSGRAALALFLLASVHVALMAMVLRVAGTMVAGWQVFGLGADRKDASVAAPVQAPAFVTGAPASAQALAATNSNRAAAVFVQGADSAGQAGASAAGSASSARGGRTVVTQVSGASTPLPPLARQRARGIGSRFAAPQPGRAREMIR